MRRTSGASIIALVVMCGCSSESSDPQPLIPPTTTCPDDHTVGGVCAGVPAAPLCAEQTCTLSSCGALTVASSDAELAAAITQAAAGDCIALAPGTYGAVVLPGGVSLLGRSATDVHVGGIEVSAGSGAHIQGLTVQQGGIKLEQAAHTTIHASLISGAAGSGLELSVGSSVTMTHSEVTGSARYGVEAFDAESATVETSIIDDNHGPGLWAGCTGGCDCTGAVALGLSDSIVRRNALVGLSLVGVQASLTNVAIRRTEVGPNFEYGGGLSISGCSDVSAQNLAVLDNADFGILVDDSSFTVTPSGSPDTPGLEVSGNLRGVWLQHVGASSPEQQVRLEDFAVSANQGVGIGVDGESKGIIIVDGHVLDTAMVSLPVLLGGVSAAVEDVGDGLNWLCGSAVIIEGLTVSGSARASVLIDGEAGAGSSIKDIVLAGGDEAKGIVQQNLPPGASSPEVSGNTSVDTVDGEAYAIPGAVTIPPGI